MLSGVTLVQFAVIKKLFHQPYQDIESDVTELTKCPYLIAGQHLVPFGLSKHRLIVLPF